MKTLFFLLSVTMLLSGCSRPDPESEKSNAEAAVQGFYNAAESFDYEKMRSYCTENFHAIEDGQEYISIDEFIEMFKFLEGSEGNMNIEFVQTNLASDHAFLIARFDAGF
jgi:hypothetical protein